MSAISAAAHRRQAIDATAVGLMLLLTLSWGMNGVAIKLASAGFSPVFQLVARSALAGATVLIWCRLRGIRLWDRDGTLWPGLLLGLVFSLEFAAIFVGLDHTSAARNALLVNTMPFWVLIGGHFLLGEHMSLRKVLGLLLAFAGVAVVFSDQLSLPGPSALFGDLLCLVGGMLWAGTTLVIRRSSLAAAGQEKVLLYQLGVSLVFGLLFLPFWGAPLREVSAVSAGGLLFQALYVVAFTYLLWFWMLRRYPAAELSSFAFLSPVFGVAFSGMILGEPITWHLVGALALIAAGLLIVNRAART